MSTSEEIREVFEQDIREKEKIVYNEHGVLPFLDGMVGVSTQELYWGILDEDDRELLQCILDKDTDRQENEYHQFSDEDKQRFKEIICEIADDAE